jgi:hypothetical protein
VVCIEQSSSVRGDKLIFLQIIEAYFSNMRWAITLILYLALVVAGLYLNLWLYQTQTGARFSVLMVGCFVILFGGYVLWTGFLSPKRENG